MIVDIGVVHSMENIYESVIGSDANCDIIGGTEMTDKTNETGVEMNIPVSQTYPKEPRPPSKYYKYLHFPTFTIAVSVVYVALFIWTMVVGNGFVSPSINPMLGPSAQTLLDVGGKWTPYILNRGEWWRVISSTYLHAGVIHILSNIITQLYFGLSMETKYGSIRMAIIYILSGIGAMLTR